MTVNQFKSGSKLTVKVEGRLDTTTAPELEAQMNGALEGISELVLDFSALTYISSAGLRTLLILQKQMNTQGSMKVTGVSSVVFEIFEVTGFSDLLTIKRA